MELLDGELLVVSHPVLRGPGQHVDIFADRRGDRAPLPIEAAQEADSLIALVDGLAAHTLAGLHDPDAALAVLERRLEQLFGLSSQANTGSR